MESSLLFFSMFIFHLIILPGKTALGEEKRTTKSCLTYTWLMSSNLEKTYSKKSFLCTLAETLLHYLSVFFLPLALTGWMSLYTIFGFSGTQPENRINFLKCSNIWWYVGCRKKGPGTQKLKAEIQFCIYYFK